MRLSLPFAVEDFLKASQTRGQLYPNADETIAGVNQAKFGEQYEPTNEAYEAEGGFCSVAVDMKSCFGSIWVSPIILPARYPLLNELD
jgi:hypothetical protein